MIVRFSKIPHDRCQPWGTFVLYWFVKTSRQGSVVAALDLSDDVLSVGALLFIQRCTGLLPLFDIGNLQLGDALVGEGIEAGLLLLLVVLVAGGTCGQSSFLDPALLGIVEAVPLVSVHQDDAAAKGVCIGDEVGGNFVEAVAHVRGNAVLSSIDNAGLQRGVQLRVSDCGGGSAQSIHGVDHQVRLGHADLQALHLVQREVGGLAQTLVDLRGDEHAARTFDQPAQSNITAVGIFHALQQLVAQTALSHILKLCHILKDIRQTGGADQFSAVVGQRRSVAAEDIQSTHLDALHGLSLGTQRAVDVQVNGDVTAGQLFDLLSKGVCANGCAVVLAVDLVPCQLVVIAGAALACTCCCRRGSGGSSKMS